MKKNKFIIILISILGVIATLSSLYSIELVYLLTPFLVWIPYLIIWGSLFLLLCISIFRLIRNYKAFSVISLTPTIILIAIVLINIYFPFQKSRINLDYNSKKEDRIEFIEKNNYIIPNDTFQIINLPERYTHLSKNGSSVKWMRENHNDFVLFHWYQGMMGEENGFLYSSIDSIPNNNIVPYTSIVSSRKLDKNWFFVWCSRD
jgi:hypothetical protein